MSDFDLNYAKKQLLHKSDEELVLIAGSTSGEYRQEVIDYAKEELEKRGANNISTDKAQKIIEKRGEEQLKGWIVEKEKGLSVRWLRFYIYFRLPFGLLLTFIQLIIIPDLAERIITLIFIAPFFILSILVYIGLRKRRIWGWKLNWVLIAIESILMIFTSPSVGYATFFVGLFWVLPNCIYFDKRRILFS